MEPVTQIGPRRPKSFAYTGLALIFSAGVLLAQQALPLAGDISPIHDPTIAREGSNYYVFSTNRYRQKDLPDFGPPISAYSPSAAVFLTTSPNGPTRRYQARRTYGPLT